MRRLHSLTGLVPIGLFLMFHLYENFGAISGAEHYNESIRAINSTPLLPIVEILVIFLPLYFHALYGIYVALDAKHNVLNYTYGRNWAFYFQRISGFITLIFVSWHIWEFRIQKLLGAYGVYQGGSSMSGLPSYDIVSKAFHNNFIAAAYIIGVVAAAYHFCNGLYTFLITWGITVGPKSQRITNIVTNALFVAVSAMGVVAVFAFR
ncbi:MAG: succinate dehydrogenase cytochrome b558 subunit [Mycobacterium leprae]